MCSTRSRTVSIPSEARRSAILGPTPGRDCTGRSSTSTLVDFGAPWSMPAKPASAGRELTERARTRGAYAPVRTSALSRRKRHADPAEPDLVGAWVVDDVVWLPRAVRQIGEPVASRLEGMRDPRAGRSRHDRPPPHLRAFVAERDRSRALEDDEELLLGRVTVRGIALGSGRDRHVAQTGRYRADDIAEIEVDRAGLELPAKPLREVRDPARARRDLADLR